MLLRRGHRKYLFLQEYWIRADYRPLSGALWHEGQGLIAEAQAVQQALNDRAKSVPLPDLASIERRSDEHALVCCARHIDSLQMAQAPATAADAADDPAPERLRYEPLKLEIPGGAITWDDADEEARIKALSGYARLLTALWVMLVPDPDEVRLLGKSRRLGDTATPGRST